MTKVRHTVSDFIARFPWFSVITALWLGALAGAWIVALCFASASRDNVMVLRRAMRPADPGRN